MGIALHLTWPSFDAEFLRTGGLRALGLTLAPSANVFNLPDMTAGGVFQGAKPLIYQQRSEVQSPLTLLAVENTVCTKLFCHLSIFFIFCKIRIFRLWIVIRWIFLCTHQLRYAQEICTTYGLMDKGHLFATGNITELRAMVSRNRRVRVKASCLPKDMVYQEIGDHIYDVDVASEHDIPLIVKRIVEAGGDLYHVSEQQMSLEEIYFSLIDREHAETEREKYE